MGRQPDMRSLQGSAARSQGSLSKRYSEPIHERLYEARRSVRYTVHYMVHCMVHCIVHYMVHYMVQYIARRQHGSRALKRPNILS